MAGASVQSMKLELPETSVQELIKTNTKQVPERYVFFPDNKACDDESVSIPCMNGPTIDLELLSNSSSPHNKQELLKLRSVLSSWGCFQLTNHGIASSLLDQLRKVGKEFFQLPLQVKKKYSRSVEWFEGYGCDTVSEDQPINWNDRMHLKIHPPNQRNLNLWPEAGDVPNFRETLDEYSKGVENVIKVMLKAIAKSLDLQENAILDHFGGDGVFFARFNFYPPCPNPERVLGLKPHSDGTLITVLLQDDAVEGLQVFKDNQWFKVPILPNALFINVGDQLEIMSNGIMKSPVHKVVIDRDRERLSVAVPTASNKEEGIGPLRELIKEDRPRMYKDVKDYLRTYLQYYARGERAINAVKI